MNIQYGVPDLPRRTGVTCPDCGAGGGSKLPCWCYVCEYRVMMLPSVNGYINSNWSEKYNETDTKN
ncbi:hypothetical protein B8b_019 [Pseudoalteromonas phage B8b]|uniref:Uncharacterized protein n=1 Tax=Pseudoalteromonas phage B8b TaxID=1506997 RepID=A0A076G658_9CAUD|nr:hypothetical protein B8b_019 [Pseudoalteromonas phage B8b]